MKRHLEKGLSCLNNFFVSIFDRFVSFEKQIESYSDGPRVFVHKYVLNVTGKVKKELTYEEIRTMAQEDKKEWQGVSMKTFLKKIKATKVEKITIHSVDGKKVIANKKGFLAYNKDKKPITKEDGFPLRYIGDEELGWVVKIEIK